MRRLRALFYRLGGLFNKDRRDQEFSRELEANLALHVEDNLRSGLTAEAARRAALIKLGGVEIIRANHRDQRGLPLIDTLQQDLRYGWRMLLKYPTFTAIAVLTLTLGIGASTAVFSLVDGILLRPLPYANPERIVLPLRLLKTGVSVGYDETTWGGDIALMVSKESKTFESVGTIKNSAFNLTGAGEPQRLDGILASVGFFDALGVKPLLGRGFTAKEDQPGGEKVVVIGYALWQRKFGGDPGVLGRAVDLNGGPYTVVGVMPRGFAFPRTGELPQSLNFPRETELWVPLQLPPTRARDESDELALVTRLKPGVGVGQAQAEMDVFARRMEEKLPGAKGWFNARVTPLARQVTGDTRRPLLILFGAVGVVLLIACANIANLYLTRSLARSREFTVRAALGAARGRLVRQILTESMLLSLMAGLGGILLAELSVSLVKKFGPASIPRLTEVTINGPVFAFAFVLALATGVVFGLVPALAGTRENLVEALKEGAQRSNTGAGRPVFRSGLLIAEMALAVALVIAAGLLVKTFLQMLKVDPGFNAARVLTFELTLPDAKYKDVDHIVALYKKALPRLETIPGVLAATLTNTVPMAGATNFTGIRIEGRPNLRKELSGTPLAAYTIVSPNYFSTVSTPILRGRNFQVTDTGDSPPVTIISNAMAKKFWPAEDPLGKRVGPGSPNYPLATIVGIAADVKRLSVRETPGPEMYVLYDQKPWPDMLTMQVALRTAYDPTTMMPAVREAIRSLDPELPIAKETTMAALVDDSMTAQRFSMLLLTAFGALALVLAAVGIYGVISYSVAQRTREIGIRIAVGAQGAQVLRMILWQGTRLVIVGLAVGLGIAFMATRAMESLLFGVKATDPWTFAIVSLLLLGVALLACYIPARRAAKTDPMEALRYE